MIARGAVALLAAVPLLAGCPASETDPAQARRAEEPGTEPSWNPDVRRPPWKFVFEKTGERCVVLRIDESERIVRGEESACPIDMEVGERLRLAGSVCIREGGKQARVMPVVCPDPLTLAEKEFLDRERALGRLPKAIQTPPEEAPAGATPRAEPPGGVPGTASP